MHPLNQRGTTAVTTDSTERESLATDYDAPRKQDEEQNEESYEELNARRSDMQSGAVDEDENSAAESFELPGADLSNEELNVVVCLLYTSPSPRDSTSSRMPSSA